MGRREIFHVWVVLWVVGVVGSATKAAAPTYTAKTLIRVLPYAEKDPMTIETAAVDSGLQERFRRSIAALIKQQDMFQRLIDMRKVQDTKWFRQFGSTSDDRHHFVRKALEDLERNLRVAAQRQTDFIKISMTCGDPHEAAMIVNETVRLFVGVQQQKKRGQISAKLANLERRQVSLQKDLEIAERALEEVRTRWGFTDLEDHNYAPAVVVRLNRLQGLRDDMLLEVRGLEATISDLKERKVDFEALRAQLIPRRAKLRELEKMVEQAGAKKKDFDLARVQYRRRAAIRNRMSDRPGAIEMLREKYKMMHNDPQIARVEMVGPAPEPLEPDSTDK
ncbi:MAG: hypothetical protein ACYST6_14690 [Planctomycetota bacterium]|jgi:uncharacterized protein involved in exopolysaccharide biosynthesis